MKECPYCSEDIQNNAIKCRYCNEWLENIETENDSIDHYIDYLNHCFIKKDYESVLDTIKYIENKYDISDVLKNEFNGMKGNILLIKKNYKSVSKEQKREILYLSRNEGNKIDKATNEQSGNKIQKKDYRRVGIITLILYFMAFSNSKILPMGDKFREGNIIGILTTETQFLLALLFIVGGFIITKNKFIRWILGLSFIVSIMYSIGVSIENEQQKTNDIMIKTWQYPIE